MIEADEITIRGSYHFWDTRKALSAACLVGAAVLYTASLQNKPEALKIIQEIIIKNTQACAAALVATAFSPEIAKTANYFYNHPKITSAISGSIATIAAFQYFSRG